ncbi:MAG: purine-nucleoside phosphorylase [Candidatus Eremiobacteraeota bacterium]|nr:purine-nucleoside phosphorylase [Candidatus Eremiobacteraeota bacterium]MDQ6933345.1 purine-nucleoside phosphorylase [Candidatus Eremiobacteraeota bacterium]
MHSSPVWGHDALTDNAKRVQDYAGGALDYAIILGSGLSAAVEERTTFRRVPYSEFIHMAAAPLTGHAGEALIGSWHNKRVMAFAGRVHLYQGFSALDVTRSVALAAKAGARALIVTNAAGALNEHYNTGDLMLISDHLNLTGVNPLLIAPPENPFIDMADAYSVELRTLARGVYAGTASLREGVYAGVLGPSYETPAEARFLRNAGADAVGMSTVLETIAARAHNMDVLGISSITNVAGHPQSHAAVIATARESAQSLGGLIDGFLVGTSES